MKQYLLSGCAAFVLAAGCGAANAQTAPGKFDVKLTGDDFFEAGVQNHDSSTRSTDFINRFHLQVMPDATADNGVEYGAVLSILAQQSNAALRNDQAYLFANTKFGSVQAGVVNGPMAQYYVAAPSGFGTGGVLGDWSLTPLNTATAGGVNPGTWLTNQNTFLEGYFGGGYNAVTNDSYNQKIAVFTPRLLAQEADNTGLLGWASYAPNNNSWNTGVARNTKTAQPPLGQDCYTNGTTNNVLGCNYQDMYEVGARYDGSFSGVSVSGSAGYIGGKAMPSITGGVTTNYHDLSAFQFGAQFGYAGVLVGGSYANAGKSAYTKTPGALLADQETWTAGISYETGPVVVGFNYQRGKDAGDLAAAGARTADLYSVGLTYTIAPGLTTSFEYLSSQTHNEAGFTTDAAGNGVSGSGNADLFLWKTGITF
jgi:outer membrane protein OmpU